MFGYIYEHIAKYMTEHENWRTTPEHAMALSKKLFLFKFINTFCSIFYIAYLKETTEDDGCLVSCMTELRNQIAVLMLVNAGAVVVEGWVVPMLKTYYTEKKTGDSYGEDASSQAEEQFAEQGTYDSVEDSIKDYIEIMVQVRVCRCYWCHAH